MATTEEPTGALEHQPLSEAEILLGLGGNPAEIEYLESRMATVERNYNDKSPRAPRDRQVIRELIDLLEYLRTHTDGKGWNPPTPTECVCGGSYGYYQPEWPSGHSMKGMEMPCVCLPEVKRKRKEQRSRQYAESANIPQRFVSASLLKMDTTHPDTKAMVDAALKYLARGILAYGDVPEALEAYLPDMEDDDEAWNQPEMLALFGLYGTGKTMIAVAIVKGFVREGVEARYAYVPDLLDDLRASYRTKDDEEGSYYELLDKLKNVPVLVLDDIGSEKATEWADEQLDKIVDYRYRNCLRTVITTNMAIGQLPPRMADRLKEQDACTCVSSSAPSYRQAKRKG